MKEFTRRFPVARAAFLASAQGSFAPDERERWVSSVLARLMFLRFLHQRPSPPARVPDEALKRLFTFFDSYRWELEESSALAGDALTPEVLGRTFEKRADQKRTGSFYTAADVTAYIARGTILPFLLGRAASRCPTAFAREGLAGQLLRAAPDRYLLEAARKGVDLSLPPDVQAGLADASRRTGWNSAAPPEYALPTETWREHLARRGRCRNIRCKLSRNGFRSINDLLTNNLDLTQFTVELLQQGDAALLRAFWHALRELSVLDPACGCGEFLLAALRVLEPLYDACLGRMKAFPKVGEFRTILDEVGAPRRAFIRRSILERNLYGVDLLPEAVEVCRLRLLLALAAAQSAANAPPSLPALDANLRSGNSLAGSVRSGSEEPSGPVRPFHWPVEFPSMMGRGGFDVIVGNPPYLENNAVREHYGIQGFRTASCGNVFALFWERCLDLVHPAGRVGMIVPVAATCTDDYAPLRELLHASGTSVVSSFNDRPSRLFRGLQHGRLCIILHEKGREPGRTFSTGFNKWRAVERPYLFDRLSFVETTGLGACGVMAKIGTPVEVSLLRKVRAERGALRDHIVRAGGFPLYCTRKLSHFVQVLDFVPAITDEAGRQRPPSELRVLRFATQQERDVFLAILNSNLFYWSRWGGHRSTSAGRTPRRSPGSRTFHEP
ncbi:MAG: Eco57I restriction-modification methylase domain-containing protein [Planctomycetes bacterium]|nr:Eco57I restriction-modification methylase domain-containing protein [Planctomycetota bacterium]